ncbi:chemotaxis protein [Sinorhizobium sp. BG8]|uniref:chemotaxis protein n=1 Tax=Sinorhizobium sp. BG8 TaxID=2613773 RepID=UPI00193DC9E4|nr:chemotaxis protein [Sinorhizobium sp. BG8]QRM53178.1 hypothetical protein F3Y30_00315 [Sinorhizobium sp. BG8]
MAGRTNLAQVRVRSDETELALRLEGARSQIEQRFLDGGGILLSVLDILNNLLSALDNLAGSLDKETAEATVSQLAETVAQLSALPELESKRQLRLASVAETEKSLGVHVADMQETLRYLRTFAITAKITGAGIQDFSSFAEEILERIQFGTAQVDQLSEKITVLGSTLSVASSRGGETLDGYQQSVPAIVESLSRNVRDLMAHRMHLSDVAEKVKVVARKVQNKVGITLSAMQIGDITRQRIEHCQSAFDLLAEYLGSPDGQALSYADRERLTQAVRHLVFQQLTQIAADFDRECTTVVGTIVGFNSEISGLLSLQADMQPKNGQATDAALRVLETDIGAARGIVRDIEKAATASNELSLATIATVRELLKGIETIKLVRTDIQYMALNTNLRCSKLGEEGRAINVVTAELRAFSSRLDETAQGILEELQGLEADVAKLGETRTDNPPGDTLDNRLELALTSISGVGSKMEDDMARLNACSQDVATKVTASMAKLDYKAELGDVLSGCAAEAAELAGPTLPSLDGLDAPLAEVGGKIAKVYTMVSEREIHARIFGTTVSAEPSPSAAQSDDELFDDALF